MNMLEAGEGGGRGAWGPALSWLAPANVAAAPRGGAQPEQPVVDVLILMHAGGAALGVLHARAQRQGAGSRHRLAARSAMRPPLPSLHARRRAPLTPSQWRQGQSWSSKASQRTQVPPGIKPKWSRQPSQTVGVAGLHEAHPSSGTEQPFFCDWAGAKQEGGGQGQAGGQIKPGRVAGTATLHHAHLALNPGWRLHTPPALLPAPSPACTS